MKQVLSKAQIEYLFVHLAHHAVIAPELKALFRFGKEVKSDSPLVFFPLSDAALDLSRIIRIGDIPVLYPLDGSASMFYSLDKNSLVFHHDLLKSAFHLLSGYEEYKTGALDELGRFPFTASLQYKLDIVRKPVVNYYFEIILEALEKFCRQNKLPFQRRPVFNRAVFALSHDIDMIDAYHFYETGYKFKMLFGLVKSPYSRADTWKVALSSLYHFVNPFSKHNPYWNFDFLMQSESERGFRTSYYFLEKKGRHDNSRYKFHQRKVKKMMTRLLAEGFEVGIHGTIQSATDQEAMNCTVKNLQRVLAENVAGIRQHFLRYQTPRTAQIQENTGLVYDATLGFAEHEGFRNSYCWPFKLYDFENDRILNVWQIPLTMMDVTMFGYRKLGFEEIHVSLQELVREVQKFKGIFSLLWHNSFFDEYEYPGITRFYLQQLDYIRSLGLEGIPGKEIVNDIRFAN